MDKGLRQREQSKHRSNPEAGLIARQMAPGSSWVRSWEFQVVHLPLHSVGKSRFFLGSAVSPRIQYPVLAFLVLMNHPYL